MALAQLPPERHPVQLGAEGIEVRRGRGGKSEAARGVSARRGGDREVVELVTRVQAISEFPDEAERLAVAAAGEFGVAADECAVAENVL